MRQRRKEVKGERRGEDQRAGTRLTVLIPSSIPGLWRWRGSDCHALPATLQASLRLHLLGGALLPGRPQESKGDRRGRPGPASSGQCGLQPGQEAHRAWPGIFTIQLFA